MTKDLDHAVGGCAASHIRPTRAAPLLLLALVAAACDAPGGGAPAVSRADSAGVAIVRSGGEDAALPWRFERRHALGGAESGPQAFYALRARQLAADEAGRVYVLDARNGRVAVFDSAGAHLASMGRKGKGPGELDRPSTLHLEADGTVAVLDHGRGGVARFAPDGRALDTHAPGIPLAFDYARVAGGAVAAVFEPGAVFRERLVFVDGARQRPLGVVERPTKRVSYAACGFDATEGPLLLPELRWSARGDEVAVSARPEYVVDLFRGGRLAASVRREVRPRGATREAAVAAALEDAGVRALLDGCAIDAAQVADRRGWAGVVPAVRAVSLAPDGHLWVERTPEPGRPPRVDVFAPGGAYLGTLPEGAPFPAVWLSPARLGAIEADEDGVERLAVYDLRRDPR